ncbi:MAG: DUF350 domain-containing protein [Desulfatitalea sp.]|nr:DUF350 domain-containing protein [Desulfatitalea sp.]NNJ98813.1 DUF350 domain-containing protein [Desulfatitalea sp.]
MKPMDFTHLLPLFAQGLAYVCLAFVFLLITKKIADIRTVDIDDDHEIVENSNLAIGLRRAGLFLACAIAMTGSLAGDTFNFTTDITVVGVDCLLVLVCLFACRKINDAVMLAHINNDAHAKNNNAAVGLAELGMYIATGFILNGAFTGPDPNLFHGMASALVFFVIGQAALLGLGLLYELTTPFSIRDEIEKANPAAGVTLAGVLIAYGIILRSSIAGASGGWIFDLVSFVLYSLYGIVILFVFNKLVVWLVLPRADLTTEVVRDRNVAGVLLAKSVLIALSLITAAVM